MTLTGQEIGRFVDYIRKHGSTQANVDHTNVTICAEVIGTPIWLHHAMSTDPCVYQIGGQGWSMMMFAWRLHTITDVVKAQREGHVTTSMLGGEWKFDADMIFDGERECMSRDFMIFRMAVDA